MRVRFGEGKYDSVVDLIRRKTHAKHALAIVIDGSKGHGFAVHLGGVTQSERIENTKAMVNALAQVGKALIDAIDRMESMTERDVAQAMRDESVGNDPAIDLGARNITMPVRDDDN